MRIGHGYDVHALAVDRPFVLGGVTIPHSHGLQGHSDADVLAHAVADAVLGALALGDIGGHFPDTDARYKGANSIDLLGQVAAMMREKGFAVQNADCTVIAQAPKLAPHIGAMRQNLAAALGCETEDINVKATTEEGLGFTGRREGVSAHCVCLLKPAAPAHTTNS